jgi:hypothetical protein
MKDEGGRMTQAPIWGHCPAEGRPVCHPWRLPLRPSGVAFAFPYYYFLRVKAFLFLCGLCVLRGEAFPFLRGLGVPGGEALRQSALTPSPAV